MTKDQKIMITEAVWAMWDEAGKMREHCYELGEDKDVTGTSVLDHKYIALHAAAEAASALEGALYTAYYILKDELETDDDEQNQ